MFVEWSWLSLSICAHLYPFAHNIIQTHGLNCSLSAYDSHMYPFPPTPPLFFSWRSSAHFFLLPQHPGFNMTRLNYGSFAWSLFCSKSPSSLLMTDPSFPSFRLKSWYLSYCLSHVPPLVHPHSLTSPITCFQPVSSYLFIVSTSWPAPVLQPCLGPILQYIPKRIAAVIPFKYLIHGLEMWLIR